MSEERTLKWLHKTKGKSLMTWKTFFHNMWFSLNVYDFHYARALKLHSL